MSKIRMITKTVTLVTSAFLLLFMQTSCNKQNELKQPPQASAIANSNLTSVALASDSGLLAYKNSPHEIYAGFYRVQGPCYGPGLNGSDFSKVPDSLDVLILFCFSSSSPIASSVPGWINTLHTKGTKVIVTGNLNLVSGATHDSVGYAKTAKYIMDSIVNRWGLDGYDIDVESNPTGQTLTDMVGVYNALSKFLGPKSGTGKLLTFDTNQPGSNSMFTQVYQMVSYVWFQAYGQSTSSIQSYWSTFSPYIKSSLFVPGFSFYEENGYPGNYWDDVHYPINGIGTGNAYNDASWEPSGSKKGGVFGYAIDRDGPLTSDNDNTLYVPTYIVSKQLIQIMNPASSGSSSGIVSGATYQLVSDVNNSSVLDVTGSGTTDGTKAELWSKNSPASNNQKFMITSVGGGYYKLQPLNASTKCLDVSGSGTADGTQVQIYTDNGSNAQKWQITATADGYYTLSPACAPGSSLDVNAAATANGTKVQIWTSNSTVAQKWRLVKQ